MKKGSIIISALRQKFTDLKITKTFYIDEDVVYDELMKDIKTYINNKLIDYVLLDSNKGGSGIIHNWDISQKIVKDILPFPIILAGGLSPTNIQDALKKVNPFGVDVMSGVSKQSKNKDEEKIYKFIYKCRELKL